MELQDLSKYKVPADFRGRPVWFVQIWWFAQAAFFRTSPQFAYRYRAWILRMFGAKVGRNTVIRPTVTVTYPWRLTVGDYAQIGDDVTLYSLGDISIGDRAVVSQKSYLCAADHDHTRSDFAIRQRPISIGSQCWIAADVFVGPGVTIGDGTVVGARSSVFRDIGSGLMARGNPCRTVGERTVKF